jgi:hypothetical protein
MDPRSILTTYRIEHRHSDGGWGEMVEDRTHHDAAEHDPERGWRDGIRFKCSTCDESVLVRPEGPDLPSSEA